MRAVLSAVAQAAEQLQFRFILRQLDNDCLTSEFDRPTHTVVPAAQAEAIATDAPRSVFDLHRYSPGAFGFVARDVPPDTKRHVRKVDLGGGVTRGVGAAYPVRWTPEDEERERRRRAKQRPPKPSRKAKTRGRKLLELIGNDDDGNAG